MHDIVIAKWKYHVKMLNYSMEMLLGHVICWPNEEIFCGLELNYHF